MRGSFEGVNMFEKEAEEYLKKDGTKAEQILSLMQGKIKVTIKQIPFILAAFQQTFQDGAEFGYNKANEWHFVSKEGFPNKDDIYLTIRKDGLHLGDYCCGGDGDIDCQSWCDYPSEEEIQDDSVIAWKEIVLPKEIKENESK